MHLLTRFSLKRSSIIVMLMLLVVAGGVYSAGKLKSELLPNIDLPDVTVVAIYPGAAPDDVRRDVSEPIEKAIAGTANLKTLNSVSNDSVSFVTAEYEYGTNMEKTQQAIQEAVNRLTLPQQVQRPTVGRFNFQDIPVLAYTINTDSTNPDALFDLRRNLNEKVIPDLKAIPGVNSVSIAGAGSKQVAITLDTKKLSEKGVTASAVSGLLQANNISFPTGEIVNGGQAIPVRVTNQFASLQELRDLVIRPGGAGGPPAGGSQQPVGGTQQAAGGGAQASGAQGSAQGGAAQGGSAAKSEPVKLSDVATVELVNAGGGTISRSNGKPSLALIVYKTQNANTVDVADAVTKRVGELTKEIAGTQSVVLFDQSTFIKESLDGLIREGLLGAILAIFVILVFLRSVRSTLVTAVSIPLSLLIALIMLNAFNISLNIMSLAGLAVAIGRVVDDSIVVLENIYRHHFQRGEPLREAAFNGTREVATAITASTITTVCVFLPLGFIAGLVSEFFRPFAVAVSVSLLASLLVALTVIPVLAMFFLKTGRAKDPGKAHARDSDTLVQRLYTPSIRFVLSRWWTQAGTIVVALLLLAGSLYLAQYIGTTFINFGSDKVLTVQVLMKPGTDLQTTSKTASALEAEIKKHPNVLNYQTTAGADTDRASQAFGSLGSASVANITLTLDRSVDVKAEADWMRNVIKSKTTAFGIDDYKVTTGSGGGPNSSAFSAVVSGDNYDDVLKTSDALTAKLKTVPDLVNVTSDAARAKPEIRVKVDPAKALEHGSTTIQIAQQVRDLLTSQKVTQVTIGGQIYDVQATYDQDTLNNLDAIKAIKVGVANPVPLSEVADVARTDGPVSISRVNQARAITVQGAIKSDSTSGVTAAAQKAIDELNPGAGTKVTLTGVSQLQSESFQQLGVALVVAIVLVYMVMVITFGSLSTPFIIMFSLPLAAIGSIVALYVTGRPLGISALIGVLMLVGIVVTNAIVLLDLVEQYKHRGFKTHDALVEGGRTRVRPIIMTAIATMFALMPLVLGFSEGSIIAAELGTVVVGGLFTSTFLTLIVVPVAYSILDSTRNWLRRLFGGPDRPEEVEPSHNGVTHTEDLTETVPVPVQAASSRRSSPWLP
ncbi:MAG: efflux RND transporter permease subunit [Chloroflexia bacterium]